MKKEFALPAVLMLSLLVIPGLACAEITCTAKMLCSSGEVSILELSAHTNAHAALPGEGESGYYRLCCSGDGIKAGSSYNHPQDIIQLSADSNAHACADCDVSPYSSHIARFSIDDPSVTDLKCDYVSDGDCGSDSCILGMSSDTNAHVADCDSKPDNYGAICCAVTIDSVPPTVGDNYGVKEGVWQDESQSITITATDADSGVDRISYAWAYDDCTQTGCSGISQTDSCVNSCSSGGSCSISVTQNTNDDLCYFATDNAANPSGWGNVNVKVDLLAPSTTCVDCPENGQVVGQPFVITLDASDIQADANKESGVDSTYICYFEEGGACSYQDYTSPVTVGSSCPTQSCTYTMRYYSTDVAGNGESPYKERIITYDKTMPTCTFTSTLPDTMDTRAVPLEWSANDPVTTSTFVRYVITAKKSTDGGQTYTQVIGTPVTINTESQTTHDFSLTEDGDFRFECEVTYDRTGSHITSSPGLYTVLVDTVDPVLELTGPDPQYVNQETFTIGWTDDDINNIDYYVLEIDGSVVESDIPGSQISTQYTGSAGNSYDISVTAYDLVGNPSSPAEKTVTIDTEPPTCAISPLGEYMNTTSFELEWSGTDDLSGIEHYEMCINTNGADCTSPTTGWDDLTDTSEMFTGSHGNTYFFRIRAVDAAGNTGIWSSQENTTIDAQAPEFAGTGPDYLSAMTSSDYEDMIVNATINDNVGIKDISLVIGGNEVQPENIDGDEGDTEWLVVWEIPYGTYVTETEFSITMTDVNSNAHAESFTYSMSECSPGDERECDPRNPVTGDVYTQGVCRHTATITCQADGTWGNCTGGILPSSENCNNLDDDCDGHVDEDLASQQCGPSTDMGICEYGSRDCVNGSWTSCLDAVFPKAAEICGNSLDDNCNGQKEEGCVCTPEGDTQPCGESSIGACELGIKTCTGGVWGTCVGKRDPSTEICGDLIDNDCDGYTDCDDSDCVGSFECEDPGPGPVDDEPFPWWILSVIGVIILAVLIVLIMYFKSQGEELSWETLKKKYSSVGFS